MLPVDLMFGSLSQEETTSAEYVMKLQQILRQVHTLARESLQSSQERQKRDYDLKLNVTTYEIGDLVYVLDSARKIGISPKLQPVWKGPYVISKVISPILFEVADKRKSFVLHHDRLKPCEDRSIPLWLRRKRNKISNDLDQEDPENEDNFCLEWLFDIEPDNTDVNPPEYCPEEVQSFLDDSVLPESTLKSERQLDSGDQLPELPELLPELQPNRSGRERRRPRHLQDYI